MGATSRSERLYELQREYSEVSEQSEFRYSWAMWEGDGSCPQGTLVPYWGEIAAEHPWLDWEFCDGRFTDRGVAPHQMPDLRGFLGIPNWIQCLNGQTVARAGI